MEKMSEDGRCNGKVKTKEQGTTGKKNIRKERRSDGVAGAIGKISKQGRRRVSKNARQPKTA